MKNGFLRILCAAAGVMFCLSSLMANAAETYIFGVVPQFEQRKLFATWLPIMEELKRRTGLDLKLTATLSVPEFERALSNGNFDFVYANPYHIMREFGHQGYIPLVRDKTPLRGVLVVRKDGPVTNLSQLEGKVLAMPSPNALGASLLLRADLERLYHITMQPLYVKTHSSVYLHVVNGLADAGGGVEKTLGEQPAQVQASLRVLYRTREMPSHPVSAHPRLPVEVREKMRQAWLEMTTTPAGKALVEDVPMQQAVAASEADYLVMKDWGLESYWVGGQ